MNALKNLLILAIVAFNSLSYAQDSHFSHIHASPIHNNPAWTGVFNNNFRLIMNYRNQWKSPTSNFNTFNLSFDTKYVIPKTKLSLNAGVSFFSDNGGDLHFGNNQYNFFGGSTIPLGRGNFISIGMQTGMIDHHIDISKVQSIDEEPLLQSMDLSRKSFDFSTGLGYYKSFNKENNLYAGFAVYHLNRPNVSIVEEEQVALYKRLTANLGANWIFKNRMGIQPSVLMYWQGPHKEINMGSFVSMPISESHSKYSTGPDMRLFFGAWFRYYVSNQFSSGFDALILSARYDVEHFILSFSCDITLSQLTNGTSFIGSPELSMIYSFSTEKKKKVNSRMDCPKF